MQTKSAGHLQKDPNMRNRIVNSSANHDSKVYRPRSKCNDTSSIGSTIFPILFIMTLLASTCAYSQLYTFSQQELIDYTANSPFDRLADGRPKVPDAMIERARELSSEEVWAGLPEKGFRNQYADGFQVLHPGKTMVGRAFTVQFMPMRADVE